MERSFQFLWRLMIEYCSFQVAAIFQSYDRGVWGVTERLDRLWVEVSDKVIYSTTAKRWAIGVPTIGVPLKPTIDYVQTQCATDL